MGNAPRITDFIAEKVGTRGWYTAKRPAPKAARGKVYIKPSAFKAIQAEFEALFGVPAY